MNELLLNRTKSGFPVSIGTGLALESIFEPIESVVDETRVVPNKIDTTAYTNYIFNVSTLLRNILNSVSSKDVLTISKLDYYNVLLEEIEWLSEFFQSSNLNASFYINDYKYVKTVYGPKDILRKATTDKQIYQDSIYSYCLDKLKKEDDIQHFSNDIKYNKEELVLIFTHVPWDLLSYKNFIKMDLLESHTGLVKTRKSWNTKYFKMPGDRDMSFLPFIEYLLTDIFGDSIMFSPGKLEKRIEIYDMLKKKNVHPLMDEFSMALVLGK
jgi:hypothetical protein